MTAKYEIGAPKLIIKQSSQSVTSKSFTLSGKATDDNYNVSVTVNGQNANVNYSGEWAMNYILDEGENNFEVVATNENGKQTKKSIVITFEIGNPNIQFYNCPDFTNKKSLTVKGKITENNEDAMLFIDDEEVYLNYYNEFSKTLYLNEGLNKFTFRAVNGYGKEVRVVKTITYSEKNEDDIE